MIDWFVIYKYNSIDQKWPVTVALREKNKPRDYVEHTINAFKASNNLYAGSIIAKKI